MDNEKQIKLKQKLAENKRKLKNTLIANQRKQITNTIAEFDNKYRFINQVETEKLKHFMEKLEFTSPAHISTDQCGQNISTHGNVYLCFLCGSEELLDIFIYGNYHDMICDLDNWNLFSPYLLLIDEDFIRYIYINDNGEMYESEICK